MFHLIRNYLEQANLRIYMLRFVNRGVLLGGGANSHESVIFSIFFQALSASVPNFIEIGGGSRKFSKKLVDLTRNDPNATY